MFCDLSSLPLVSPKVVFPASVVREFPQGRLSCSAIGIPPIYIAIIRNSTTLVNTTNPASIQVREEGDYTCQAISKYGTDEREFTVINGEETLIMLLNFFSRKKRHSAGEGLKSSKNIRGLYGIVGGFLVYFFLKLFLHATENSVYNTTHYLQNLQ